jgi:hypothetical protein
MAKHDSKEWVGASIGIFVVLPILIAIGTGALVILFQCLRWLKLDTWEAITLRDGLAWWSGPKMHYYMPQTGFLGLDRILLWALNETPIALWLIVIAPLMWGFLTLKLYDWLFERLDHSRDSKAAK